MQISLGFIAIAFTSKRPVTVKTAPRACDDYDASFALALWPGLARAGEIGWRFVLRASWNWLPDRIYRREVSFPGEINSAAWTGRDVALIGFGEWRRSLWVHRQ
jgi:hypothetical protein